MSARSYCSESKSYSWSNGVRLESGSDWNELPVLAANGAEGSWLMVGSRCDLNGQAAENTKLVAATVNPAARADIDPRAWYHDGVHFCLENGYMNGVATDKFAPAGTLSRAMIVTMLWRMEGKPVVNYAMSFKDVKAGQWYTEAIRWAAAEKIVEGYSDGTFDPMKNITREELATILYRFAGSHAIDAESADPLALFTDRAKISAWALDAMQWANAARLMQGRTATTLAPQESITRAEAATMVQRYCEAFRK